MSASTIPFNFRTAVFCLLMGSVLSIPITFLPIWDVWPNAYSYVEPPMKIRQAYPYWCVGCVALLPFWSGLVVRSYAPLSDLGFRTFVITLIVGTFFGVFSR